LHEEGQELRQHDIGLGTQYHRVGRADAVEIGHGQLALVDTATAEDDVALLEAQFGGLNIIRRAPAPNLERVAVEMFQADVVFQVGIARLNAVIDVDRYLIEAVGLPAGFKSWYFQDSLPS